MPPEPRHALAAMVDIDADDARCRNIKPRDSDARLAACWYRHYEADAAGADAEWASPILAWQSVAASACRSRRAF